MHTSVYVYGEEVFDGLATKEKNPARKKQLIDSLMMIYDMRITNCGEEQSVMNRKAFFAYKHLINSDDVDELLAIMDADFNLNGTECFRSIAPAIFADHPDEQAEKEKFDR